MTEEKSKKTRVELKIDQKQAIIEYKQKNPSKKQTELCEYFGKLFKVKIPPTTMSGILSATSRNRIARLDDIEAVNKRIRECKYPDLERMLFVWYVHAIKKTVVSDDILILKAKEFGQMLGIIEGSSLSYSKGWLNNFKNRYKIKQYEIYGESGSISQELVEIARKECREFIKKWLELGNGRSIKDIFNLDETALFYKLLPNRTLASSVVEGKKVNKERITIAIISNADGSEKIKPLVIGKFAKPRSFGKWNPNSIVSYYYNSTAWMTMDIFEKWLKDFNRQMKLLNRYVLILVDNASGHNISEQLKKDLSHVELYFFKPNVTSHIQPDDQGIIKTFKCFYRRALVRYCVRMIDEKGTLTMPDLKQAIFFIKDAWTQVTKETVANCWRKAGMNLCYMYILI